jgi:hypothetical protein
MRGMIVSVALRLSDRNKRCTTVCCGGPNRSEQRSARRPRMASAEFAADRPYGDPERAARKLIEIANAVEAIQDGRIHIENINGPFLFEFKGSPAEYSAGLDLAITRGWLWLHESRFQPAPFRLRTSLPEME